MKPQSNEGIVDRIVTWWRGLGSRGADAGRTRANRPPAGESKGQTGSPANTAREKADKATAPATDTAGSVQDRVQRATAEIDQRVSGLARPLEGNSTPTDTVADASGDGTSGSSDQTAGSRSTVPDSDTNTSAHVPDGSASPDGMASASADVQSGNYGLGNLHVAEEDLPGNEEETPEAGNAGSVEDDTSGPVDDATETVSGSDDQLSGHAGSALGGVSDSASGISDDLSGQASTVPGEASDSDFGSGDNLSGQTGLLGTDAPRDNAEETSPIGFGDAAASDTESGGKPLDALGLFGESGSDSVTDLSYLDDQDSAWFSFDDEGESSATDAAGYPASAGSIESSESAGGTVTSAADMVSGFSDPSGVFSDASSAEAFSPTSGAESDTTATSDLFSDASTTFETSAGEASALSDQRHDSAGGWVTSWSDEPEEDALSSTEPAGSASDATTDVDVSSVFDAPAGSDDGADTGDASSGGGLTASSSSSATGHSTAEAGTSNEAGPHAGQVRGNADGSCPVDFPIKGNGSSKIYHAPGRASYEATIAEWCFATEAEAEAAGFRAPKR